MNASSERLQPHVRVECVVLRCSYDFGSLEVLLQRQSQGWALPNAWVRCDECLHDAMRRALEIGRGLRTLPCEQMYTCRASEEPGEHVSVAYSAIAKPRTYELTRRARWHSTSSLPVLSENDAHALEVAQKSLRHNSQERSRILAFLPAHFTLSEVQKLYETVLERPLDKRNFQRKIHRLGILEDTGERQRNVPHRAARYFTLRSLTAENLRGILTLV